MKISTTFICDEVVKLPLTEKCALRRTGDVHGFLNITINDSRTFGLLKPGKIYNIEITPLEQTNDTKKG